MDLSADTPVGRYHMRVGGTVDGSLALRIFPEDGAAGEVPSARGVAFRLYLTIPIRRGTLSWSWEECSITFAKRRLASGKWIRISTVPGPDRDWFRNRVVPSVADWIRGHEAEVGRLFERCLQRELRKVRDQARSYAYIVTHYCRQDRADILAQKQALVAAYEGYLALLGVGGGANGAAGRESGGG